MEGAFNNVSTDVIRNVLMDEDFSEWIMNILDTCMVNTCLSNIDKSTQVRRGTPQDGVVLPLW